MTVGRALNRVRLQRRAPLPRQRTPIKRTWIKRTAKRAKSSSASSAPGLAYGKFVAAIWPKVDSVKVAELARASALRRELSMCRACDCGGVLHRHEEPPRSHGGWKQLLASGDVLAVRRRIVMICNICHLGKRHGAVGQKVKLRLRILNPALGTDGPIEVTETGPAWHRVWISERPLLEGL
jgi:hypothetical protein